MKTCDYKIESNECYIEDGIHIGTEDKLNVMESYVTAWIPKVLKYIREGKTVYKGVVFIDAMSNSGLYKNKDQHEIKGTSLRVIEIFEKSKNHYPDKSFLVELNDNNKQSIECQGCRIGYSKKDNITVNTSNMDVSEYLQNITKDSWKFKTKHTLLFYDPYNADIRWEYISNFINKINNMKDSGFDLIITHFYQNDPKRTLKSNIKNQSVIQRYENTYGITYTEMLNELNGLSGIEQNIWFRNRLIEMICCKTDIPQEKIAYAPVFNSNNMAVYDIVFASHSPKAKELFKITMHNQIKDKFQKTNHQFALDLDDNNDYKSNKKLYTEKEVFYSVNNYCKEIAKVFSESSLVSNDELKSYLQQHFYIPSEGIKTQIDKILKGSYSVNISRIDNEKVYSFPKYNNLVEI